MLGGICMEKKAAGKQQAGKGPAGKSAKKEDITKDMTLGEVVIKFPQTMEILFQNGLHCIGCHISAYETIEQGALAHGLCGKEIEKMVEDMNKRVKDAGKN